MLLMEKRFLKLGLSTIIIAMMVITFNGLTGYAVSSPGPGAGQTTVMLQEADVDNLGDAYVGGDQPNTNYGSAGDFFVKWGSPKRNSYLRFNISAVPSGQIIDNSSLCLYLWNDQGSQTIGVYEVVWAWNESGITWNNQPCGTAFDNSSSCNLTAESDIVTNGTLDGSWQCWSVLNIVKGSYDAGDNNVSMVLHTTDSGNADKFYPKEHSNSSLRPYLNITYHAINSAPIVNIASPVGFEVLDHNISIALNYTAADEDGNLDACWYNLNDGANVTLVGCGNSTFDAVDGSYDLNLYVNDSEGLEVSDSVSFSVSVSGIELVLLEPSGTKNSKTGIEMDYAVSGSNLTCWYNVWFSTGGLVLDNTSIPGCVNSQFDVSVDGDYTFNIFANNSIGVSNSSSSSFTVDTSSPSSTSSSSSSGGGGGGSFAVSVGVKFSSSLSIDSVKSGENTGITIGVTNTGTKFLNSCSVSVEGEMEIWFSNGQSLGIGGGEKVDYLFGVDAGDAGEYVGRVVLTCDEGSSKEDFALSVYRGSFSSNFVDYVKERSTLTLSYSLEELDGSDKDIEVKYEIIDLDGIKVISGEERVTLGSFENGEFSLNIDLPKNSFGEFDLTMEFDDGVSVEKISERIFLPVGTGISGLAVSEVKKSRFSIIGVILVSIIALLFILRFMFRLNRRSWRSFNFKNKFIPINFR